MAPPLLIFTLEGEDGGFESQEVKNFSHVPRVGELVTFDPNHSYQVVDVLWHLGDSEPHVSIRACELDWHKHIADVQRKWGKANHVT